MACEFGIAIRGEDAVYARQAADAALSELPRIEGELSRFRPDSDVARINALPPGRWLTVGPDSAACLRIALRAFRLSAGTFDPAFRSPENGRSRSGFGRVKVDLRRPRVRVSAPVSLDLGGIGKGHAVDRLVLVLREWGIRSALVHAGTSSVRAIGGPWFVALRHPVRSDRTVGRISLSDQSLGASAQARNGPHIRDPRTGRPPARSGAWAWHSSAALADALSTACLLLPVVSIRGACRRVPGLSVMIAASTGVRVTCRRFGAAKGGATR